MLGGHNYVTFGHKKCCLIITSCRVRIFVFRIFILLASALIFSDPLNFKSLNELLKDSFYLPKPIIHPSIQQSIHPLIPFDRLGAFNFHLTKSCITSNGGQGEN